MARSKGAPCRLCGDGTMTRKKVPKHGALTQLVGLVILLLSMIGAVMGGVGLFGTTAVVQEASEGNRKELRDALVAANVSPAKVDEIVERGFATVEELDRMPEHQRESVRDAQLVKTMSDAGTAVGAGLFGCGSGFIFVVSLVGSPVGLACLSKRVVLRCGSCRAVQDAA